MVICWGMVNMAASFTMFYTQKKVVLPDLNAKIIGISRKIHSGGGFIWENQLGTGRGCS